MSPRAAAAPPPVRDAHGRLAALDTAHGAGEPVNRQLASAFECALLDIWSQVIPSPCAARYIPPLSYHTLFDCAQLTDLCSCCSCPSMPASSTPGPSPPPIPPPCCTTPAHVKAHSVRSVRFSASGMTRAVFRYYTVGLNEVADMQASYVFGLKWTPHTKIKGAPCNRHTPHCKHATQALTPPPQSMTTPPASSASWPRSSPSSPPPQTPCMCPAASCFNTAFLL